MVIRLNQADRNGQNERVLRGYKSGMSRKISCAGREIQFGGIASQQSSISEERNDEWPYWKSEGFIVPIEGERQQNDTRGKEPCFIHATEEEQAEMIATCY